MLFPLRSWGKRCVTWKRQRRLSLGGGAACSVSLALFCPSVYFVQTGGRGDSCLPKCSRWEMGPRLWASGRAVVFSGRPASAAAGTAVVMCVRAELSGGWSQERAGPLRRPAEGVRRTASLPHGRLRFRLRDRPHPWLESSQSPAAALAPAQHLSVSRASRICRCGFCCHFYLNLCCWKYHRCPPFPPIGPFQPPHPHPGLHPPLSVSVGDVYPHTSSLVNPPRPHFPLKDAGPFPASMSPDLFCSSFTLLIRVHTCEIVWDLSSC